MMSNIDKIFLLETLDQAIESCDYYGLKYAEPATESWYFWKGKLLGLTLAKKIIERSNENE